MSGNRIIPMLVLLLVFLCGLDHAREKIVIDGDAADWAAIPLLISDPNEQKGQFPDRQNVLWSDPVDIREVKFFVEGTDAYWFIRFWGSPAWPNDPEGANSRGHYGILLDLDNDVNSGWNTAFYEGQETSLGEKNKNIGAELFLEIF